MAAACSSSERHASPSTSTTTSVATTTVPTVAARPVIAWSRLRNPLFASASFAAKDPAIVAVDGEWVALYSSVDAAGRWRIGIARSHDLTSWSGITTMPHDPATEGEASPDVLHEHDGTFVVTYQSFVHDRADGQAKLYARTTRDFRTFSDPIRLLGTGGFTRPTARVTTSSRSRGAPTSCTGASPELMHRSAARLTNARRSRA